MRQETDSVTAMVGEGTNGGSGMGAALVSTVSHSSALALPTPSAYATFAGWHARHVPEAVAPTAVAEVSSPPPGVAQPDYGPDHPRAC